MKRKIISILSIIAVTLCMQSCGGTTQSSTTEPVKTTVSTTVESRITTESRATTTITNTTLQETTTASTQLSSETVSTTESSITTPQITTTATTTSETTTTATNRKQIVLTAGKKNEYSKEIILNAKTDMPTKRIGYFIPAGKWKVTNIGNNAAQFSVYSEKTVKSGEWEEPAETPFVALFMKNDIKDFEMKDGCYVYITEPGEFNLSPID